MVVDYLFGTGHRLSVDDIGIVPWNATCPRPVESL